MILLTLDPSDVFGFALGDPLHTNTGRPQRSGTYKVPDVQLTRKMLALEAWMIGLVKAHMVTDVIIEQPIMPRVTSFDAVASLVGKVLVCGIAAAKCGCSCYTVDMSTWRSELGLPTQGPKNVLAHPDYAHLATTNKGAARKGALQIAKRKYVKDRAMEYAIKHGSMPADDNEGDAICIWHWKRNRMLAEQDSKRTDLFSALDV